MRIGIFGGTFDPVHVGHLILAEQCREQGQLDQVWFLPAPRPPHKTDKDITPFAQRVEMLALAIAGHSAFRVEELEKDRPGPSYTADTLDEIHQRHSEAELFLLLGSDMLKDLPSWHEPARIAALATLLVMVRPDDGSRGAAHPQHEPAILPQDMSFRQQRVDVPLIGISSRDLRQRAAQGRSLRYFVPRAVEAYILDKRLYLRSQKSEVNQPTSDR